jgi:hypothetical protein
VWTATLDFFPSWKVLPKQQLPFGLGRTQFRFERDARKEVARSQT